MGLDLGWVSDAWKGVKEVGSGVADFFRSPNMQTARSIAEGASSVMSAVREAASDYTKGEISLGQDPNVSLGQYKVRGTSRSNAGVSSFNDISEANFYKYAQMQNMVKYLYQAKHRYKKVVTDKKVG